MDSIHENKQFAWLEVLIVLMVSVTPWIPKIPKAVLLVVLIISKLKSAKPDLTVISVDTLDLILFASLIIPSLIDVKNAVSSGTYSLVNFLYPVNIFCGYLIARKYGKEQFLCVMEKIVFILAILSLVGMSVYYIKPSAIYSFPTYVYYGKTNRTLFFFNYQFSDGWMSTRNAGIAWEPGVFQILLNLGLYVSIRNNRAGLLRVLIYCAAIAFTKSTMGYAILLANIALLLKRDKRYWLLLAGVTLLFSTMIYSELQYQVAYKLMGSSAFESRLNPLINAVKYCWNKPLGIGSTGYDLVYQEMNLGSFDSYTQILMRYGYPLLACIIIKIMSLIRTETVLGVILLIALFSEPVWGGAFFSVFYFLSERNNAEVEEVRDIQ